MFKKRANQVLIMPTLIFFGRVGCCGSSQEGSQREKEEAEHAGGRGHRTAGGGPPNTGHAPQKWRTQEKVRRLCTAPTIASTLNFIKNFNNYHEGLNLKFWSFLVTESNKQNQYNVEMYILIFE